MNFYHDYYLYIHLYLIIIGRIDYYIGDMKMENVGKFKLSCDLDREVSDRVAGFYQVYQEDE